MTEKHKSHKTPIILAEGAIFAALVAIVTYLSWIPIPATTGYLNFGETVIYIAALVLGPYVGAFAGGGAAIADLLVPGGAAFAPGTFVIKTVEGFTIGFLNNRLKKKTSPTLSAIISVLIGGVILVLGYFLYEIPLLGLSTAIVEVPFNIIQMLVGLIIAIPIMHAVQRVFPQLKS